MKKRKVRDLFAGEKTHEPSFAKSKLVRSSRFSGVKRDVLGALLDDGSTYTISDAELILDNYLKGMVE